MPVAAVHGLAVTGRAVATALAAHGWTVRLSDDRTDPGHEAFAASLGASLHDVSTGEGLTSLLGGADMLVPAPGVPPSNRVVLAAESRGVAVRSELDLAYEREQSRPQGPRPLLGVTGTDGKTTTTMLAAHMLEVNGIRAAEVGNTDVPFLAAVDDSSVGAFVVECSSFRLDRVTSFRCEASVWLNLAPDHLDWHPDIAHYRAAKARLWASTRHGDVAVAPSADPSIVAAARDSGARVVTFGADGSSDYGLRDDVLVGPGGPICTVGELWRPMPHDVTNSLAAAALVVESGLVPLAGVGAALATFVPAGHRIQFVGEFGGTRWYDDSKATSPHAALTAIRSFDRLVLIAGGRNKGLDLGRMASEPHRMSAVVAIGDDAPAIEAAFRGVCPVVTAGSMQEAVREASHLAGPGVPVVLSPGCTSYDWYRNYNERGDDFQHRVRELFGEEDNR
ncbi:MAG: UDP-N-acetylmuramoylalanine--D-glutamate ligase [Actinomycetota bacterium]|jgi:UDP-N-acetylmuramoylalanine--D-glutamate ligase